MNESSSSHRHEHRPSGEVTRTLQIQSLTPGGDGSGGLSAPTVVPMPQAIPSSGNREGVPHAHPHPQGVVLPVNMPDAMRDRDEHAVQVGGSRKRNLLVTYWERMGGGSFLISVVVHAGLLIGAFFVVKEYQQESQVDFMPHGESATAHRASVNLTEKVQQVRTSFVKKPVSLRSRVTCALPVQGLMLPEIPMDDVEIPEIPSRLMGGTTGVPGAGTGKFGPDGQPGGGRGSGTASNWVQLPISMRGRCGSAERLQKLKESGGSAECERAVINALEYLKSKQKLDGGWGTSYRGAMTGFALLCYLGRCETPESIFYGDNVMQGILFLVEMQKKNPYKRFSQATSGNGPVYEHGIATYALGEMYTLARMGGRSLPGMREAFEQGVQVIIDNQQAGGSWVYDTEKGFYSPSREDLSVTGWQYQALKSAKLSGLQINGLNGAIEKTVKYLEGKQTKDGGIGTSNREGSYNQWNLTGAGALGLQTLAHGGKKTEIKKAIAFAHDLFKKEPPAFHTGDMYGWYYYHQAFFQHGGEEWKVWNEAVLPQILKAQQPDGSWKPNGAAHNPSAGGDNVYSTALCTLMLEVYYRYLKVGDREQRSMFER